MVRGESLLSGSTESYARRDKNRPTLRHRRSNWNGACKPQPRVMVVPASTGSAMKRRNCSSPVVSKNTPTATSTSAGASSQLKCAPKGIHRSGSEIYLMSRPWWQQTILNA